MRNLIKLATTFAIALTEADVEQLGYDVEETEFLGYFGIDKATHENKADFSPMDNSEYMTAQEEKEAGDSFKKAQAKKKGIAKPSTEPTATEPAPAKDKDAEKAKKAEEKAEAAKAKKEAAAKAKEEKAAKAAKEPKVKAIANWKKVAVLSHLGLHFSQIRPLIAEDIKDSYISSDCRKAKNQPEWANYIYVSFNETEKAEIAALLEQGKALPITETADEIKAKERAAEKEAAAKAKAEKAEADKKAKEEAKSAAKEAKSTETAE